MAGSIQSIKLNRVWLPPSTLYPSVSSLSLSLLSPFAGCAPNLQNRCPAPFLCPPLGLWIVIQCSLQVLTVSLLTTPPSLLAGPENTIRGRRPVTVPPPSHVRVLTCASLQTSLQPPMSDSIQIVDSTPQPPVFQVALLAHDCAKKDSTAQEAHSSCWSQPGLLVYVRAYLQKICGNSYYYPYATEYRVYS